MQGLGDVEKALIEQSAAAVLNIDEDIACNARPQCKRLLSHPLLDP
ncbi:Tripartite motif-containing protein 36 [Mycobacterium intracellulare subsp. intracellulare MTCC 9506]|uniref:Tripartite motif-containing protein 36 n=1 Tax=Mycobacterium indicus pranii (strain DSM 45239 / MTCC 9506) TaxID=1232724 RepID=J9WCH5_MYCIP|nr:Tripartite motif-containing protein 36 [Mycobacterium intracellulare subsp. intracellulare MTCC 9506]